MGDCRKWIVQTAANRTLMMPRCVLHAVEGRNADGIFHTYFVVDSGDQAVVCV